MCILGRAISMHRVAGVGKDTPPEQRNIAKKPAPGTEVPIAMAYPAITTNGTKTATTARLFKRSEMYVTNPRIMQAMT